MSVWFMTGAWRGFGLEVAAAALAHGDQAVASARNPEAIVEALPEAGGSLLAVQLELAAVPEPPLRLPLGRARLCRQGTRPVA
jgi:NAD(P)-dependent dehydrogenase (short-subunit alcohol dehydrogenase family)